MTSSGVYVHGHAESVLRSHSWRTAANSAAYLVPELRAGLDLLDVGCGVGTITADLAGLVAPGRVVGVDTSAVALQAAAAVADAAGVAVAFEGAEATTLPFEDDSFDVVHAHQVLQHLADPVAALAEMRRVTRPGGVVAVRDADYAAMTWYPPSEGLSEWLELYHEVADANGVEADAGRRLHAWVRAAGFDPAGTTVSASAWCFATPEDRAWWSSTWAERVTGSQFARQALGHGLADDVALEALAEAWTAWGEEQDGWFAVLHGEVLARV